MLPSWKSYEKKLVNIKKLQDLRANMNLDNMTYNKIKIIYKMSEVAWFINKNGLADATKAGDNESVTLLLKIQEELENHVNRLKKTLIQEIE